MITYLNRTQIAHQLGIKPHSLRHYKLPPPDATIGNHKGWLTQTITTWNQQRPGKGRWKNRPNNHRPEKGNQ